MGVGLEIFNDGGVLQVSQDVLNYEMKQKGTVSLTTSNFGGDVTYYTNQVNVLGVQYPLLAIRCTDLVQSTVALNGTTASLQFISRVSGASVDYWLFSESGASSYPNYGLEVFDAGGARVFHSGGKPLRPVGSRAAGAANFAFPAGRTYAGIQSGSGYTVRTEDLGFFFRNQRLLASQRWSGTTMITPFDWTNGLIYYDEQWENSETPYTPAQTPSFLVVDVTNF